MNNEFTREERYIVFKLSDVEEHFTPGEKQQLARLVEVQRAGREEAGKPLLKCVVVEKDWAEYEPTWRAIEARVTGVQPTPSGEKDEPIRKAWARFSNELHRSPDAPYPGMADAFERHFSQSFTDREWRAESATWAAAWKAAKRHEAQPALSVPDGWLPVPEKHPTFDPVDLQLSDGSVLCGCVPQSDGDYWWEGPSGEVFIDPRYAPVTHWRLAAAPEAKP